ncbi:coenzyme F420-0:L-glutamate ligase [Microbacterium pseudoresistens]|uniref:Coenzyme F420-0:L-glutamate ligase/coenzyme F420-1:gamma-L-glutamate ligase n=1 Tax=Microbacterium pseudoresistens TaxID=640634 RepID=A0A7Y9EUV0_9MICO|nr:coenzyme F420-0:L-glutamate ligase [Microbacterium pseudoresistens]NYD54387.1 coenzyme F420-0:L-glutamate ligase/coenzyme F420-1:gamma-L-glutamate ligase [Microbacterium pseudoresistens]
MSVWALPGMPEVRPGDDLAVLIREAVAADGYPLVDGDILVVTSKIVSKAEGRVVRADDREAAITAETVRIVATRERAGGGITRIVQNRLGIVGAAAGVDASNTAEGTVLLLPLDPDASARTLAAELRRDAKVGVIVSDTLGRPWRDGQTDVAIGAAGVRVFDELHGEVDSAGRPLIVTRPCVADELAAAGDLVKGKLSGCPVAIVRGMGRLVGPLDLPGAATIVRAPEKDMFRLGADEAHRAGYDEGFAAGRAAARGEDRR